MSWMHRVQQRLAITRHEGLAVLTLSGLLLLGLAVQHVRPPAEQPDPATYTEVEARFRAHTIALPGANRPEASDSAEGSGSTAAPDELRIDLNTASASALQQLPGIGPALSERILTYRRTHGGFARVEEITRVHGIGPKTLAQIEPMLYVEEDGTP